MLWKERHTRTDISFATLIQRTTFGNKRLYHFSANGGTPDKAGAEVLTQFIPELPAYFAQLEFKGQVGLPTSLGHFSNTCYFFSLATDV
jgi:hypothetical protein